MQKPAMSAKKASPPDPAERLLYLQAAHYALRQFPFAEQKALKRLEGQIAWLVTDAFAAQIDARRV